MTTVSVVLVLFVFLGLCTFGTTETSFFDCIIEQEFESRIIGGSNAKRYQFPYIVSIQDLGKHECGGSILSKTWVVTAGHCFKRDELDFSQYRVVAGLLHQGEKHKDVQNVSIARVIFHPDYNDSNLLNDIALVKLSPSLKFTPAVKPIHLPPTNKGFKEGWVAGWGMYMRPSLFPVTLQYMKMPIIDNACCKELLDRVGVATTTLSDKEICTSSPIGLETTCYSDSGGPLSYNNTLIGITSWGPPCEEYSVGDPSVFTRVSKYIDFIKKHVKGLVM